MVIRARQAQVGGEGVFFFYGGATVHADEYSYYWWSGSVSQIRRYVYVQTYYNNYIVLSICQFGMQVQAMIKEYLVRDKL